MCLLLFSYNHHPSYRLILAANRDEYYRRPTKAAAFWPTSPPILAGRDEQEGGTWLGITRSGRLAALTNYRDPASFRPDAPSRGLLASRYLLGNEKPLPYLEALAADCSRYNGFSLIVGDGDDLYYFSNRGGIQAVTPGIHGLSNHLLDTPWPKVIRGKEALAALHAKHDAISPEEIFSLLGDTKMPPDDDLPDTGVGLAWERILSPLFIQSPDYGTRSSTVLLIDYDKQVTFIERTFEESGESFSEVRYTFFLD